MCADTLVLLLKSSRSDTSVVLAIVVLVMVVFAMVVDNTGDGAGVVIDPLEDVLERNDDDEAV